METTNTNTTPNESAINMEHELAEALREWLFIHDNADETGYVTDVGFYDVDKAHEKASALLARYDEAPTLPNTELEELRKDKARLDWLTEFLIDWN